MIWLSLRIYPTVLAAHAVMCAVTVYTWPALTLKPMAFLSVVLHFTQSTHNINRVRLSSNLLNLRVVNAHEDVVFLFVLET
jgi:hypothetical protein